MYLPLFCSGPPPPSAKDQKNTCRKSCKKAPEKNELDRIVLRRCPLDNRIQDRKYQHGEDNKKDAAPGGGGSLRHAAAFVKEISLSPTKILACCL